MKLINAFTILATLMIVLTTGCTKDEPFVINPQVASTYPLNNASVVGRNKAIVLTFNQAMDPLTINTSTFIVKHETTEIGGTVTYSGMTATFTHTNTLAANTLYTCSITTGAKNMAGDALLTNTVWSFTTDGANSGIESVDLGEAVNYVILAKSAIINNSTSSITGDLGLSPAASSYITGLALTNSFGFATSSQIKGNIFAADMEGPTGTTLTTAVSNMISAYNNAASRPSPDFSELGSGDIGGRTLLAGLYNWTNGVNIPTSITISGSPTDVWIFQISGDLTVSSAVNVSLSGGARARNIFWQVAGQATLESNSHFEGIILSKTAITLQAGASLNGRAMAQSSVNLDGNIVAKP